MSMTTVMNASGVETEAIDQYNGGGGDSNLSGLYHENCFFS
jgi:hypothetical protein